MVSVGVGFQLLLSALGSDAIFVGVKFLDARHESLPQPRLGAPHHWVCRVVPIVEIPRHSYRRCLGRTHKTSAIAAPHAHKMATKQLICLAVGALMEQIDGQVKPGRLIQR